MVRFSMGSSQNLFTSQPFAPGDNSLDRRDAPIFVGEVPVVMPDQSAYNRAMLNEFWRNLAFVVPHEDVVSPDACPDCYKNGFNCYEKHPAIFASNRAAAVAARSLVGSVRRAITQGDHHEARIMLHFQGANAEDDKKLEDCGKE